MCVMCSTSVPTLFQYFFYDHIPTFLYIFHEMFFITCYYTSRYNESDSAAHNNDYDGVRKADRTKTQLKCRNSIQCVSSVAST